MRVVLRFAVTESEAAEFAAELAQARALLAAKQGCLSAEIGRNVDDPDLWLFTSAWADVGSYRRALSAMDVRMRAHPVLARAIDEPSAYEDALGEMNRAVPREFD